MQSPAGTATAILAGTSHFLYLGYENRFDMATFDVANTGSFGVLKWEFTIAGSGWTEFQPMSGAMKIPPLVFSFGVKGKTSSRQPLGAGSWDF